MPASHKISSGVQELIERLRNDGVAAGEAEAARLIKEAKDQATAIVAKAKKEADDYRASARAEIEREKEAAHAAVQIAARDTILEVRADIAARFGAQIKRIVARELQDPEFLRRMILAVAGASMPEAAGGSNLEIRIADVLFGGKKDGEISKRIDQVLMGVSADMLREGVEIKPAGDDKPGMRARLAGEDIEIDLTEEAITEALLRHTLPRFRAILQGMQEV